MELYALKVTMGFQYNLPTYPHLAKQGFDTWHKLLLTAPQIIDLPLKLDNVGLSLFLEIIDYLTFALMMQLKRRHTLCWTTPCITLLYAHSINHYLRI